MLESKGLLNIIVEVHRETVLLFSCQRIHLYIYIHINPYVNVYFKYVNFKHYYISGILYYDLLNSIVAEFIYIIIYISSIVLCM